MVSKHKIEKILTWHKRGYDEQLIAHHLGLDPRAVHDILRQAKHPTTPTATSMKKPSPPEFSDVPLF